MTNPSPAKFGAQTIAENTHIDGVISQYFETLNAGNFEATAALFASDGVLHPPFESAVVGRDAIVTYLETEARGLRLFPMHQTIEATDTDTIQCRVTGKVQTPLFGVNVGWFFVFNRNSEILSVEVKLLAALEELLTLKTSDS